ncbi:cysteine desulfurase [bacterium]|nr:cysteine desulfurase [bacterium]
MIYLDNAATTRPHPQVLETVQHCLSEDFGNPSSPYMIGTKARQLIDVARKRLATAFNVPQIGIIFCSSGTESDNLALKGLLGGHQRHSGRMITTRLEHSAVIKASEWLSRQGIPVDFVQINQLTGQVDLNHLEELMQPDTRLVSIQHVNSETGIIQDLAAISRTVKSRNPTTIIHTDGVQAFSKFPVDMQKLGVDLYSISGHKFHAIKGAGALVMSRKIPLEAILHGGGQEFDLRSGTENVAAIAGLGLAADLATSAMEKNHETVATFAHAFKSRLQQRFPSIRFIEAPAALPHIISLSIPGIPGEVLLNHLADREIYVATGSACNAGSKNLSPVLQTMGFSPQRIRETIRISLAASEVPDDLEGFLNHFSEVVEALSQIV